MLICHIIIYAKKTRGRKKKIHKPVPASFDEVLKAVADSNYIEEKKLKVRKNNDRQNST